MIPRPLPLIHTTILTFPVRLTLSIRFYSLSLCSAGARVKSSGNRWENLGKVCNHMMQGDDRGPCEVEWGSSGAALKIDQLTLSLLLIFFIAPT